MRYAERLTTPLSWWVVGLVFGVTFVTAVGFYLGPEVSVFAGVATAAGIVAFLGWAGRSRILVEDGGLTVDRAHLEWEYAGEVRPLDPAATRARLGVDANAAAWVVQRPWLRQAVEVTVTDPADPHPYWLVASREPVRLAAAIEAARRAHAPS